MIRRAFRQRREIAALRVAVCDLYSWLHDIDPDPAPVDHYIVDPKAQEAATWAIRRIARNTDQATLTVVESGDQ